MATFVAVVVVWSFKESRPTSPRYVKEEIAIQFDLNIPR